MAEHDVVKRTDDVVKTDVGVISIILNLMRKLDKFNL